MRRAALAFSLALCPLAAPAVAGEAWETIRPTLFADRPVAENAAVARLVAPARATDDRAVPLGVEARAPEGAALRSLTLVIDENPMPVSAVVSFVEPTGAAAFTFTMRLNGPSDVRVLAETTDGGLHMSAAKVKTSGLGACAAPPGVDAATAMATLGDMSLTEEIGPEGRRLTLGVSHPSYSGLQMDQITLLYTPVRYVERVEVSADDRPLFTIAGSISLSENPAFTFGRPHDADVLRVRVTDSDGATFERRFALGEG